MQYEFTIFTFNDKEIDQIVALVDLWVKGIKPDRRTLTPNVRKYAVAYGLLTKPKKGYYYYTISDYFDTFFDLPIEALYRAIAPMIADHTGYTITTDPRWKRLNVTPKRDIATMEGMLLKLDMHGKIYFQSAGNIWRIEDRVKIAS